MDYQKSSVSPSIVRTHKAHSIHSQVLGDNVASATA